MDIKMKNIELSICIPTYNRASLLKECIESILQSIGNCEIKMEIIISDNDSKDDTEKIVKEFKNKYLYIKYYKNSMNIGANRNIYLVAKKAIGKYIWIIGDDDIITEDAIKIVYLKIKKNYDLVITNYSIWSRDFLQLKKKMGLDLIEDMEFENKHEDVLKNFGIHLGYISSIIIKKNIFFELPEKDYEKYLEYGLPQILAVYSGIARKSKVFYISSALVQNRENEVIDYDWYKYFIVGSSLIFEELRYRGYSRNSVRAAKYKVINDFVIHDLLTRKRDRKVTKGLFIVMYPFYKCSLKFWGICVPILIMPNSFFLLAWKIFSLFTKNHKKS